MVNRTGLLLILLSLGACGDSSISTEPEDPIESEVESSLSMTPPIQNEELFTGSWIARDPETNSVMVEWDVRVENDRWVGSYTLTEHFCQTSNERRVSACPFSGQSGDWEQIIASNAVLSAKAADPFQTDALFTLQMLAPDGASLSTVAFSADLGSVQLNTDIERQAE